MSKLQMKWAGVGALFVAALFLLYPTVNWYSLEPGEREKLEAFKERPKYLLNLGLDLKGGTHLLMELDVAKLDPKENPLEAMARAIEIIRNRVDQFGVAEPLITRQGKRWIVVQLPGISNAAAAKEIVGKTALLEFRMMQSDQKAQDALGKIAELGNPFTGEHISTAAARLVPEGMELFKGKESSLYLLSNKAPFTGADLETARVGTGGDYGMPVVEFKFKGEKASAFAAFTGANVGKNMAIILDSVVYSAPVIKSRISGGSGIIEGQFTMQDAHNLSIVLRAGALPAPVRIIEERTIGPTLGEDSIRSGVIAVAIAGLAIVGFMIFYYRLSGLITNLALALNLLMLLAGMAYFGSTLTLPGIAGIVLTMGMAVDANVLILERIKEELAAGKPVRLAVDAGYEKAFSAILDSNLTTVFSGVFLFQFGTGPIKGFAVTLIMGLAISMFTAITVTKMIYDAYLAKGSVANLSV